MDRDVRAGRWRQIEGLQLYGKILGIIGLGGVGREVARIALGVGMQVLAWNRSPVAGQGVQLAALEQVLAAADILCVTLALNEETRGLLREPPSSILARSWRCCAPGMSAMPRWMFSRRSRRPRTTLCWRWKT